MEVKQQKQAIASIIANRQEFLSWTIILRKNGGSPYYVWNVKRRAPTAENPFFGVADITSDDINYIQARYAEFGIGIPLKLV
jgi:hypothetical protein